MVEPYRNHNETERVNSEWYPETLSWIYYTLCVII